MSLIDGIGDEVTQFLLAVLLIAIVTLAWWSTNTTRDPRSVRSVYLLDYRVRILRDYHRTYHSNRVTSLQYSRQNNRHPPVRSRSTFTGSIHLEDPITAAAATGSSDLILGGTNSAAVSVGPVVSTETVPPVELNSDQTDNDFTEAEAEQERAAIIRVMDADETEVRRRRIAFFAGRGDQTNGQDTIANEAVPSSSSVVTEPTGSSVINTTDTEREEFDNSGTEDENEEERESAGETNIYEGEYDRELDSTIMEHNYAELPIIDNRTITIKLKYTNDEMKVVTGKLQEKLGDFKLRHFSEEYSNDRSVRLIFNGKILNEDERTISSCGIFHNCVVHCLVIQGRREERPRGTPPGETPSGSRSAVFAEANRHSQFARMQQQNAADRNGRERQQQQREWNLGTLLSRCITFLLICAWYLRYSVPHIWTMTATMCLVGLTGLSFIAHVGVYMPNGQPSQGANVRTGDNNTAASNG